MTSIVDSHRPGRRLPPTNRFADSSDEEDEEERRLLEEEEEEEEQERILSEQHGEAEESTATRRKRSSEADIEAEYGVARKKVKRPTLTPATLLGPKGLIRIRSEFHRQLRWPSSSSTKDAAAAAYSRSLVQKYKSFCYDLFPGSAFEDMLSRIESFGSKKEVKTYLQTMREEIRNNHLENIYGKEKANRMIQELEHGLKQQHEMNYEESDAMDADENERRPDPVTRATSEQRDVDQSSRVNVSGNADEARPSEIGKSSDEPAVKQFTLGDNVLQDTDDELEIVVPRETSVTQGRLQKSAPSNPFDSDKEEENEELNEEVGNNVAEQKNASNDKVIDDKNASNLSPADKHVGAKEAGSDGFSTLEDEDPTSSDENAMIVVTTGTQLRSLEQEKVVSCVAVEENPFTPSGAFSSDETATIVATVDSQLDSPEHDVEKHEPLVRDDPFTPTREQEPLSTFDETATIVATMNTQLDSPQQEEKGDPSPQEDPSTPDRVKEPTSSSDETATIVATMLTMDSQLDSPEQEDMLEHGVGSS